MLVAHVLFKVAPADRSRALDALLAEAPGVRAMAGCLAFVPFADPGDPGGLGIVHEWQSGDEFGAYTGSSGFAKVQATLRPMMVGQPVSRRFDARLLEVPG